MKKPIVSFITLLSIAPQMLLAQSYSGYSPTVGDLNAIFDPPANLQNVICQNFTDGNDKLACSYGVASAKSVAEKYAQSAGKYLGCIDGFQQGVYDGYIAGKNATEDMRNEAKNYVAGVTMLKAEDRAAELARTEAETASADQIISRYRKVIGVKDSTGRQTLPNKSYQVPKPKFQGFTNGYETDVLKINSNANFEQSIAMKKANELQTEHNTDLCDNNKTIFGRRSMPQLTIWDYFRDQRQQDFQNYGWKNAGWAWEIFTDPNERGLDQIANYNGLATFTKTIMVPVYQQKEQFKKDAAGNYIPKKDANGVPLNPVVYETEIVQVQTGNELKTVKVDANDVKKLQNIYYQGFVDAYSYYAKQYASIEYNKEGLAKYSIAKIIGSEIGKEVARQTARKDAYNDQYQLVSAAKYAEVSKDLYIKSFNRLIKIFENNPVVELNSISLSGVERDGIFRASEGLIANFTLTNLGEVSRPVSLNILQTNDIEATGSQIINPPVLDSVSGSTEVIAMVSPSVMAKRTLNVGVTLSNPSDIAEVSSLLKAREDMPILIDDFAELKYEALSVNLNLLQGELTVRTVLTNPSEVETPAFPTVEVLLEGNTPVVSRNVNKISAKGELAFADTVVNLDPFILMTKNELNGVVQVKLAGKIVDRQNFSVKITERKDSLLAKYFHSLVKKASNGNIDKERMNQVIAKINSTLDESLENSVIKWKRQAQVNETIIGDLQAVYQAAKANNEITSDIQAQYDAVASLLAHKVNNKGQLRIRGLDKHFLKALKVFSPSLSTKWRDFQN